MAAQPAVSEPQRDMTSVLREIELEAVGALDIKDTLASVAAEVEVEAVVAEGHMCALRHRLDEVGRGLFAKAEQFVGARAYLGVDRAWAAVRVDVVHAQRRRGTSAAARANAVGDDRRVPLPPVPAGSEIGPIDMARRGGSRCGIAWLVGSRRCLTEIRKSWQLRKLAESETALADVSGLRFVEPRSLCELLSARSGSSWVPEVDARTAGIRRSASRCSVAVRRLGGTPKTKRLAPIDPPQAPERPASWPGDRDRPDRLTEGPDRPVEASAHWPTETD